MVYAKAFTRVPEMNKKPMLVLFLGLSIALSSIVATKSFAHSGGTNSDGCHQNKKSGDYHCHNKK
jgi:hypothetical protein